MKQNKTLVILMLFFMVACIFAAAVGYGQTASVSKFESVKTSACGFSDVDVIKSDFFYDDADTKQNDHKNKVYLGGNALGLSFDGEGVIVIGVNEFLTENGLKSPAAETGIKIGDILLQINGTDVKSSGDLSRILSKVKDKETDIKIKRGSVEITTKITPLYDIVGNSFKLGLWVKDSSCGIGTLSFVLPDGVFGCLGHPVVDDKTGKIAEINGGNLYTCGITGIEKGERGKAGSVRGVINSDKKIGKLVVNNKFGVYGKINDVDFFENMPLANVAAINEVAVGKAKIRCALDGLEPKYYDIEIVKASKQKNPDDKGLVIKVTDKKLIELTGGIVQGMSGSPIIQKGKFVGAVTHVFVNDPTRGYGIYGEWMIDAAEKINAYQR